MTRQKTQEKETAILEAAIAVFAERGFWNTPTSLISKTAGIADGTLFTYFGTKDELIHAVYLGIKRELAAVLLEGLAEGMSDRDTMAHFWNCYIDWGVAHPDKYAVVRQIYESGVLSADVLAQGIDAFGEIEQRTTRAIAQAGVHQYPSTYLGALIDSQVNTTIQFIVTNPDSDINYKKIGFDILWDGVTSGAR